jgi:hypothetical protein
METGTISKQRPWTGLCLIVMTTLLLVLVNIWFLPTYEQYHADKIYGVVPTLLEMIWRIFSSLIFCWLMVFVISLSVIFFIEKTFVEIFSILSLLLFGFGFILGWCIGIAYDVYGELPNVLAITGYGIGIVWQVKKMP